jgi:signal transduction histidine kinase
VTGPIGGPPGSAARERTPVWGSRATWQITLRWFVPPAILVAVVVARLTGFLFPVVPPLVVAAFIQTYNFVFWWILIGRRGAKSDDVSASPWPAVAQVALDYAAMFVLVQYTGGVASPLVFFFLFHVIFAAILLEARLAWLFALAAVAGLAALSVGEFLGWVPTYAITFRGASGAAAARGQSVLAVLAFGVSTLVTAGMTAAIVGRLRAENARAVAALEALAEERARLMLHAAHNLRSPLTASMSILDVLIGAYAGPVNDDQKGYLERVRRRLSVLNDMIGELLALARSRGHEATMVRGPVDLGALAAEVGTTYAAQAAARHVALTVDVADGLPTLSGDADLLRRMIENLVGNAVKYTPDGGRVDVVLMRPDAATVQLVVRDTGIGIPAAEQAALFTQFFRASNARALQVDGTGLGLAIVRQTVEQHGGTVDIASTEGQGTTVMVRFPVDATAPVTPR